MPTLRMRRTPAASASATTSVAGRSIMSTCAWLSITAGLRRPSASPFREQRLEPAKARAAPAGPVSRLPVVGVGLVERRQHALGGCGHVGVQQHGDDAQPLDERAQDAVEVTGAALVAGNLPWSLLLDIAVEAANGDPDRLERGGEV